MHYISPFRLFPSIDFTKEDANSISYTKLKRKLLAEFELNDNQPLSIGKELLGKSEALRLLEALKDEELFTQHLLIAKNEELLDFLGGASYSYLLTPSLRTVPIPDLVVEEFVDQYDKVLSKAYQQGKISRLEGLLKFPIQELTKTDKSPYEGIYRKLKNEVISYEQIALKTSKEQEQEMKATQDDWSKNRLAVINCLPFEFDGLRNQLAVALIEIAANIYNDRQNGYLAGKLFRFVEHLECHEEYKTLAAENFTIAKGEKTESSWTWDWSWRTVLKILAFVFIAVRLFYSCSDLSNSNNSFGSINIIETEQVMNKEGVPFEQLLYSMRLKEEIITCSKDSNSTDQMERPATGALVRSFGSWLRLEGEKKTVLFKNSSDKDVVLVSVQSKTKGKEYWYYVRKGDEFLLESKKSFDLHIIYGEEWVKKSCIVRFGDQYSDEVGFFASDVGTTVALPYLKSTEMKYEEGYLCAYDFDKIPESN